MGDWRDNPANNAMTGQGSSVENWYDSPIAQDMLMRQKLISQGVPPEQLDQIMAQIKQVEGLKGKMAMAEGLPPGQSDTLQAQPGYGGPPQPNVGADPGHRPGGGPGGEMLGDLAPGAPDPTQGAGGGGPMGPPSGPALAGAGTGASQGFYDNMTAEESEALLSSRGIQQQIATAEGLRDQEGPKGMYTKNMYVSANPLSHLASGVEKYRAKKDIKSLRGDEKDNRSIVARLLRNKSTKDMTPEEIIRAEGWDEDSDDVGFGIS